MATGSAPRFRHWRGRRPFAGGLLLLTAGLELFLSANLTLEDLQVHFGQEGYLSYLLPAVLILCGTLTWASPAQRLFYGILGLLTSLYSFIGLNLGGFVIGMLVGIVGGALTIAWTPAQTPVRSANSGDPATGPLPGRTDGQPPDRGDGSGVHRTTLALILVPLAVLAVTVAGGRSPAQAQGCPENMPSRSAPARSPAPAGSVSPASSPADISSPSVRRDEVPAATPAVPSGERAVPASPPTPATPAVPAAPSAAVSPSASAARSASGPPSVPVAGSPSGPASPAPAPTAAVPSADRPPAASSGTPGRAGSPSPGTSDVPCLGPRVVKQAGPDDVPAVAVRPGVLQGDSLTMYGPAYDGVVELQTPRGPQKALRFSMRRSVTKQFSLTVAEAGGGTTLIRSRVLTTEGNVRFYTSRFSGRLFGLIPVTFTPERPPPLTLPVLSFTDVRIDLAFVRCDTLTGDPLRITANA